MKKLSFSKILLPGLILLLTACSKESTPGIETPDGNPHIIKVQNSQVAVKLVSVQGFSDPCFDIAFNSSYYGQFRFTGGPVTWEYKDLKEGLHKISFTCMHDCVHENGAQVLRFEIDDGLSRQKVSSRQTDHCTYDIWLNVN